MQTGFDSPEQLHNSIHIAKGRGRKFTSGKPIPTFLIKVVNFFIKIVNFFCIQVNFFSHESKLFVNFFCCLSSSDVNHFAKMLTFSSVCQLTCELSTNLFCLLHTMSKPSVNFNQFRGAAPARAACRAGSSPARPGPARPGHACRGPGVSPPPHRG